jgi:hypothetical protein
MYSPSRHASFTGCYPRSGPQVQRPQKWSIESRVVNVFCWIGPTRIRQNRLALPPHRNTCQSGCRRYIQCTFNGGKGTCGDFTSGSGSVVLTLRRATWDAVPPHFVVPNFAPNFPGLRAKLLTSFLTCATWRVTVRCDTDDPSQGTETAF